MTAVFLDYDQERLDYHIDVRRRVPAFASFSDRFAERSAALRTRTRSHLDLRYGPHPRERLDVFLPDGVTDPVAANLFFHGGYWRSSEKERYSYVADLLLPAGAASVVVEYALIPDVDMDELIRQCRAALAWIHANGPEYSIDPARLFVSGHSAGGQIVGMLAAAGWHGDFGLPADVVRGACGISGLYDLEPIRLSYLNSSLGLDADAARRNSPAFLPVAGPVPFIAAVGGDEGDEYLRQNSLVAAGWGASTSVTTLVLDGLHHYSAVEALGDASSALGRAVLGQMGLGAS